MVRTETIQHQPVQVRQEQVVHQQVGGEYRQEEIVEEVQRPMYNAPIHEEHRLLREVRDKPAKDSLCPGFCFPCLACLGCLGLILGLLFGLNVFGGGLKIPSLKVGADADIDVDVEGPDVDVDVEGPDIDVDGGIAGGIDESETSVTGGIIG